MSDDIKLKSKWFNALCSLASEKSFFGFITDILSSNLTEFEADTKLALKFLKWITRFINVF